MKEDFTIVFLYSYLKYFLMNWWIIKNLKFFSYYYYLIIIDNGKFQDIY